MHPLTPRFKGRVRVAVVNTHPIQYCAPLYAYLNSDPALEVTAIYCSDFSLRNGIDKEFGRGVTWDVDLLAGYPYKFLDNKPGRSLSGFWSLTCPHIWAEIRSGAYDVVWLNGYHYAASVLAFVAARSIGLPILMRSETHLHLRRRPIRRRVRDGLLTMVYRSVDGFLAIGSANRDYYRALNIPDQRIFDVPYAVDNARFIARAEEAASNRAAIRAKYGLPHSRPVVLYASKFLRRKHPDTVLRAVAALQCLDRRPTVFMVGAGEMDAELRELAASMPADTVVFGGFVNQAALPEVYAASDVFVLPARDETWGLVVNEVMCAGVPVVVSEEVGCVADLVRDGVNGFLVPPGDVAALTRALNRIIRDDALRAAMGAASRNIIASWSFEECRRGLSSALAHVATQ